MRELYAYLAEVNDTPFRWGIHDCLTYTNEAWRRMHGTGWSDDWLGRYMNGSRPKSQKALKAEYGFDDFSTAANSRMRRVTCVPPRGALVAATMPVRWRARVALGICVGTSAAMLGNEGIVYLPIEQISGAWIK